MNGEQAYDWGADPDPPGPPDAQPAGPRPPAPRMSSESLGAQSLSPEFLGSESLRPESFNTDQLELPVESLPDDQLLLDVGLGQDAAQVDDQAAQPVVVEEAPPEPAPPEPAPAEPASPEPAPPEPPPTPMDVINAVLERELPAEPSTPAVPPDAAGLQTGSAAADNKNVPADNKTVPAPTASPRSHRLGGAHAAPSPRPPLYVRLLDLQYIHPNGWQRALFAEGSLLAAGLLVLADMASAWLLLALPAAVAVVVKAHDVVTGMLLRAGR